MPNWCNNTVKIFGSKEKIKALEERHNIRSYWYHASRTKQR
jgi:hypothetical protein